MSQRRSTVQPFDERLYGMFTEVFRATGTMPGIEQSERIRQTCTEIMNEFLNAGGGHEALKNSLNAMKPVVKNLEGQIKELREQVDVLRKANSQTQNQLQELILRFTNPQFPGTNP
jgi:chromosome segregation ATPase